MPCTLRNRKPRGGAAPTALFPAPRPRTLQRPATEPGPAPCRTTRSQRCWAQNAPSKPGRLEASPPGTLSSVHVTLHPQKSGLPPLWPGQIKHIDQLRYSINKGDGEEPHYSAWDPQPYLDSATSVQFIRGEQARRALGPHCPRGMKFTLYCHRVKLTACLNGLKISAVLIVPPQTALQRLLLLNRNQQAGGH